MSASTSFIAFAMIDDNVEKVASSYRRLLREGVPKKAVKCRMFKDGIRSREILEAVFQKDSVDKDYFTSRMDELEHRESQKLLPRIGVPRHSAQAQKLIELWKENKHKREMTGGRLELIGLERAGEISVTLRVFDDMTQDELAEAIDCLKPMPEDRAFLLGRLVPTDEERHVIQAFCGMHRDLAPASRWLSRSLAVPEIETKVKVMQIMDTFPSKAIKLGEQFHLIERACDQVMDSPRLKNLLGFVLRVGKVLIKEGKTDDSSALLKVAPPSQQAKKNGGRMTVFDFVVRCAVTRETRSLDLMGDLPDCEAASQLHVAELLHDMTELTKALETCKAELKAMKRDEVTTAHWCEVEVSLHQGVGRLERFVTDASIRLSKLEFDRDVALTACQKVSDLCHVCSGKKTTACLGIITKFAKDLDEASRKYFEREYAAWKRQMEERGKAKSVAKKILPMNIDKRHLRHVHSMVEMYDQLLGSNVADPEVKKARQLIVAVISVGPTLEERVTIDKSPLHRVKSLAHLYNALLKDMQESTTEKPTVTFAKLRKIDTNDTPKDVSIQSIQFVELEKGRNIDTRPLRHVKSLVGQHGELLIESEERKTEFGAEHRDLSK